MMNEILDRIDNISIFGSDAFSEIILDDFIDVLYTKHDIIVIDCYDMYAGDILKSVNQHDGNIVLKNFSMFIKNPDTPMYLEMKNLMEKLRDISIEKDIKIISLVHTYNSPDGTGVKKTLSGGSSVMYVADFVGIFNRSGEYPDYNFTLSVIKDRYGPSKELDVSSLAKRFQRERKLEQLLDKKPLKLDNGLSQKENKKGRIWQIFQNS